MSNPSRLYCICVCAVVKNEWERVKGKKQDRSLVRAKTQFKAVETKTTTTRSDAICKGEQFVFFSKPILVYFDLALGKNLFEVIEPNGGFWGEEDEMSCLRTVWLLCNVVFLLSGFLSSIWHFFFLLCGLCKPDY